MMSDDDVSVDVGGGLIVLCVLSGAIESGGGGDDSCERGVGEGGEGAGGIGTGWGGVRGVQKGTVGDKGGQDRGFEI